MLEVSIPTAEACRNPRVQELLADALREHEAARRKRDGDLESFSIARTELTDELIEDLRGSAETIGYSSFERALTVLQGIRKGKIRSIPNLLALSESLLAFLELNFIDGWAYRRSEMGFLQAIRVDTISYNIYNCTYVIDGSILEPSGQVTSLTMGPLRTRGLPTTILGDVNLLRETPELKEEYLKQIAHLREIAGSGPGYQCIAEGLWASTERAAGLTTLLNTGFSTVSVWDKPVLSTVRQRRVVVESLLSKSSLDAIDSQLRGEVLPLKVGHADGNTAEDALPLSPLLQVFDLSGEGDQIMASPQLTSYSYREDIRDQLILPESHGKVLDVLTSKTGSILADVIQGKGAGNLVLCKGVPGVGKTLTAEIVAETLKRPMYTVDASSILGAGSVREAMAAAFDRVRRWDGVLLLDEADVVIGQRGNDLARNKVTAELLRALESFERLAFLTTNRPDDVDDAILSRCVAIIEYRAPTGEAAVRVWQVLGDQLRENFVSESLAREAAELFERMAPRDIRQLLRLSYQIAEADGRELSIELLRECAVFRAWTPAS